MRKWIFILSCMLVNISAATAPPLLPDAMRVPAFLINTTVDNKVLELDLNPIIEGGQLHLFWGAQDGMHNIMLKAQPGKHLYEMRYLKGWQGHVEFLSFIPTLPDSAFRLKDVSLTDELELFLTPSSFGLELAHSLDTTYLFGYPWHYILLGLWYLISISLLIAGRRYKVKQKLWSAFIIGFFVVELVMDGRQMVDHFLVARHVEDRGNRIPFFVEEYRLFLKDIEKIILHGSWGIEKLDQLYHTKYAQYQLAAAPYIPLRDQEYPDIWLALEQGRAPRAIPSELKPEYVITLNPGTREVLFKKGRFYLVKGLAG